eukprot:3589701-Alexandrium_andersonii.AAC.1
MHLDPPRVGSVANRAPRVLRKVCNLASWRGSLLAQVQHGLVRQMVWRSHNPFLAPPPGHHQSEHQQEGSARARH